MVHPEHRESNIPNNKKEDIAPIDIGAMCPFLF